MCSVRVGHCLIGSQHEQWHLGGITIARFLDLVRVDLEPLRLGKLINHQNVTESYAPGGKLHVLCYITIDVDMPQILGDNKLNPACLRSSF